MPDPSFLTASGLLSDPRTPYWIKDTLRAALERDPVDAASAIEVLAGVLRRRSNNYVLARRLLDAKAER